MMDTRAARPYAWPRARKLISDGAAGETIDVMSRWSSSVTVRIVLGRRSGVE